MLGFEENLLQPSKPCALEQFHLVLNTHLQPIIFMSLENGTNSHVLFFCKVENSSSIALTHRESTKASWIVLGSKELTKAWGDVVKKCLALDLVSMGWTEEAGTDLSLGMRAKDLGVVDCKWLSFGAVETRDGLEELVEIGVDIGGIEDCATWEYEGMEKHEEIATTM